MMGYPGSAPDSHVGVAGAGLYGGHAQFQEQQGYYHHQHAFFPGMEGTVSGRPQFDPVYSAGAQGHMWQVSI